VEGNIVSVERVIAVPAADLFTIVADANRHPEIDGSGAVVKAKADAPHMLTLGATFLRRGKLPSTTADAMSKTLEHLGTFAESPVAG
jgi:hypothetical protein